MKRLQKKVNCPECGKKVTVRTEEYLGGIYAGFCEPCNLRITSVVRSGKTITKASDIQHHRGE